MRTIGPLLKQLRQEKNVTQKELAKAVGAFPQFISNVESGFCGLPAQKIKRAARFLRVNPEILISAQVEDYAYELVRKVRGAG